jgi:tetratricopeptide (TPR) repeat protein
LQDQPYHPTCPNFPLHPSFIEVGRELARAGDIEAATQQFKKVLALDPRLSFDPNVEARRIAAQSLVEQGWDLAHEGEVEAAVVQFKQALDLYPDLNFDLEAESSAACSGQEPDYASGDLIRNDQVDEDCCSLKPEVSTMLKP